MLRIDPALPTLRIEPALPTLSIESTLAMLPKLNRLYALNALATLQRLRQLGIARAPCRLRPIAASMIASGAMGSIVLGAETDKPLRPFRGPARK